MELSILTDVQARQLFREELSLYFENNPIREKEQPQSIIVDLDGLVKARPIIGSKSTIYKKVSSGKIPHSKRGKKLFFDLVVIDKWLLEKQILTTDEMEAETMELLKGNKKRGIKAPSSKLNSKQS